MPIDFYIKLDNQSRASQPKLERNPYLCVASYRMDCHDKQQRNLIALFSHRNHCDIVN
jgi:hypothetical protein